MSEPTTATHASGPGAGAPLVAGRCRACGGASLFLANSHVTCARLECPDPTAVDDLLHGGPPDPVEVLEDALCRRVWAAALRWAAGKAAEPFAGAQDGDLDSTDLRQLADQIEAGRLTPWADQPEPAGLGEVSDGTCRAPASLPSVNVEESTEGPDEWPVCGRELPCQVHDQSPDPTHGRIDRDIQAKVNEMNPTSLGQRVAIENTLQSQRDARRPASPAQPPGAAPAENGGTWSGRDLAAVKALIAHQRRDIGSCICGWGVNEGNLGQSHALHVWRELQRAAPSLAALTGGDSR